MIFRHISYKRGKYIIQKRIDGVVKYYGCFTKLSDALCERDLLVASNWDFETYVNMSEEYTYIEELLPPFRKNYTYIKEVNNHYYIVKSIKGNITHFKSGFLTLDEALQHKDFLEENNWEIVE